MSARKSSAPNESLAVQAIQQQCKLLRLGDGGRAIRDVGQTSHTRETNAGRLSRSLLSAELEERERRTVDRRLREARLPRMKTLDERLLRDEGGLGPAANRVGRRRLHREFGTDPVSRRLRHGQDPPDDGPVRGGLPAETAGALHHGVRRWSTNSSAKQQMQLSRVLARWSRYELIAIDEVGYVPLAEVGAEFLVPSHR